MNNQDGFTLIEWLIYFFLICTILTGMFHFVATNQQALLSLSKKSSVISQMCAAQDGIARDIATAPTDLKAWNFLGPEQIAWQTGTQKIGWSLNNGSLYRAHQEFDQIKKMWGKNKKAVVARNINTLIFTPHYKKNPHEAGRRLFCITCCLQQVVAGHKLNIERTTLLQNRVIA